MALILMQKWKLSWLPTKFSLLTLLWLDQEELIGKSSSLCLIWKLSTKYSRFTLQKWVLMRMYFWYNLGDSWRINPDKRWPFRSWYKGNVYISWADRFEIEEDEGNKIGLWQSQREGAILEERRYSWRSIHMIDDRLNVNLHIFDEYNLKKDYKLIINLFNKWWEKYKL